MPDVLMFKRQLTSAISAFVLAVHMLAGCCAHHDHNELCSDEYSVHTCTGDGHNHGVTPHHHHNGEADPASDHQHPRGCDGGQCVFVVGGKVSLPKLSLVNPIAPVTIKIAFNNAATWTFDRDLSDVDDISPHLRTHLAKRVLRV